MITKTKGHSFGELLGAEIREAREARGWTQLDLALTALGDENAVRRIGDYETGKVKRPQAKVYQPICDALGISRQRIGALKAQAGNVKTVIDDEILALRNEKGSLQRILSDLQTLSRAELETLASRFELAKPYEASDGELVEFLSKKAQDYRALRAEFDAIDDGVRSLANLKAAAMVAFDNGDFDAVEVLLSRVQGNAKVEIAKAAEIRADAALVRGRPDFARALLIDAADSFAILDPLEPARRRNVYGLKFYNHGLRYGGDGLRIAAEFFEKSRDIAKREGDDILLGDALTQLGNALATQGTRTAGHEGAALLAQAVTAFRAALEFRTRDAFPKDWASTQNNLALALATQGTRTDGPEGAALLAQAVTSNRAALEVLTRDAFPKDWASTQNNLAIALEIQGSRADGPEGAALLAQAVTAYRAALEIRTRDAFPVDWAMTQNNLAAALQTQGSRTAGPEGAALLAQAVTAYRAALEVRTRDAFPVDWASTQNNLAAALQTQGSRTAGPEGAALLAQAVTAYRAALEVRTRDAFPVDWASTQNNLAVALQTQGIRTDGPEGAALLAQAVTAYRAALEVRTRDAHPVQWAETQENLALTEESRADHDTCADPLPHLRAALDYVTAALEIFDPEHMPYDFNTATKLKTRLEAKLAALNTP